MIKSWQKPWGKDTPLDWQIVGNTLHTLHMLERHFLTVKVLLARKREQGWCSDKSARLPPMLLTFYSGPVPYMGWICCWFLPCSDSFYPGSPLYSSTKTNTLNSNSSRMITRIGCCGVFFYIVMEFKFFIYLCCGDNAKICIKFSGFEFVSHAGHIAITTGPVVIAALWALLLQTVSAITKKWTNVLFLCRSLLTVSEKWRETSVIRGPKISYWWRKSPSVKMARLKLWGSR